MALPSRPRRRFVDPWWRRMQRRWLAATARERFKSNRTRYVDFPSHRYKEIRFPSISEARRVEHNLCRLRDLGTLPGFVFRLESTVWVRYVNGSIIDPARESHRAGLIDFFARLYGQDARLLALEQTDVPHRLAENVRTLSEVGVLDTETASAVTRHAQLLQPATVWIGFEYIDALRKNFIASDDRVVGIDVEAIHADQLLGIGLAKATHRWFDYPRDALLTELHDRGVPDLGAQYGYAALSFLCNYAVQCVFRGKYRQVGQSDFERLILREEA
jgi:hypothetical protein